MILYGNMSYFILIKLVLIYSQQYDYIVFCVFFHQKQTEDGTPIT